MFTATSASFTASELASASLYAWTVLIPSSRAARMIRTAISPRLAIRSVLMVAMASTLVLDVSDRLTRHDRFFVVDQELDDLAGELRLYLVKRLHHFDKADRIASGDPVALGLERRRIRRGPAVESAGERRNDLFGGHVQSRSSCSGRRRSPAAWRHFRKLSRKASRTAVAIATAFGVSEWTQML